MLEWCRLCVEVRASFPIVGWRLTTRFDQYISYDYLASAILSSYYTESIMSRALRRSFRSTRSVAVSTPKEWDSTAGAGLALGGARVTVRCKDGVFSSRNTLEANKKSTLQSNWWSRVTEARERGTRTTASHTLQSLTREYLLQFISLFS